MPRKVGKDSDKGCINPSLFLRCMRDALYGREVKQNTGSVKWKPRPEAEVFKMWLKEDLKGFMERMHELELQYEKSAKVRRVAKYNKRVKTSGIDMSEVIERMLNDSERDEEESGLQGGDPLFGEEPSQEEGFNS